MAHVYVTNLYNQIAYVSITKSFTGQVLDLFFAPTFKSKLGLMQAAADILFKGSVKIETADGLFKALKLAAEVLSDPVLSEKSSVKAATDLVAAFKEISVDIAPDTNQDLKNTKGFAWVNLSNVAGLAGAKQYNLTIMTEDGKKVVNFDTNFDHSWIVRTSDVVRAKYGTLRFADPASGLYPWAVVNKTKDVTPEHGGFLWRLQNKTLSGLTFDLEGGRSGFFVTTGTEGFIPPPPANHLRAGTVNGWGEGWRVFSEIPPNDIFGICFAIYLDSAPNKRVIFDFDHIPSKFIYGSRITVIIREQLDQSTAEIEHPTFGKASIKTDTYLSNR